jgi:hemolysin activation/secretion protein
MTNASTSAVADAQSNPVPGFNVASYVIQDNALMPTNVWVPLLSKYTGTNVSLGEIVKGAEDLQSAYRDRGYPMTSIAIAQEEITNGVVTLNVFQTAIPQIVVSGVRYYSPTNAGIASNLPAIAPVLVPPQAVAPPVTNAPVPVAPAPMVPATRAQMAEMREALLKEMARLDTEKPDTMIHVVSTNAGPRFDVEHYRITGNTVLSPQEMSVILTNIDGAFGTNVSFEGVRAVVEQLQKAYSDRGYLTVAVGLPQQKLTNATVKVRVTEGRLVAINVQGNVYFSSNNIMRALPSLHTNILVNGKILQGELNRANANQDRKIYPVIGPGPDPGSSALTLHVKDQLPLHAKVDLDNFSSPGTPALRVNNSAVYNNLWQQEHSLGLQYSFSPEVYKSDPGWNFYDRPAVVNYSAFYRLPLGNPASLADQINANPGTFGYSEATRKFNLPPMSGLPSLTFFASRSAIDTGTANTFSQNITAPGSDPSVTQNNFEHSPTINEDIAAHLDYPLASSGNLQSSFSEGLDFKTYELVNYKTNVFTIVQTNFDQNGNPILPPITSEDNSPVPATENWAEYLPLTLHYTGSWRDSLGFSTVGLGLGVNLWYNNLYATTAMRTSYMTNSAGKVSTNTVPFTTNVHGSTAFKDIAGSSLSSGYWVVINPSYSRTIVVDNWTTLVHVDGQWASEPLISPEQFGAGGVSNVRGYPEGDVFGDEGWHFSLEEQTPAHTVGTIYGGTPLTVFGSIYMDYATVYLIDPQGRPPRQRLWGAGAGFTAAAGPHWQARFLFSVPLYSTSDTPAYEPLFNFSLTAQF